MTVSTADARISTASNDFRTDTITTPLPEMIAAMSTVSWGDSVFDEDESTKRLEAKVAALTGKEAGLYCVSGTLSNQLGIRCSLSMPPHSVLCDDRAHIYSAEAGGLATLSQAMVTPVRPANGVYLTLEDVQAKVILGSDIHTAPTRVISLENTLWGTVMPVEEIKRISQFARAHDIKMHLDGARIWNASAATGVSLAEYAEYFDSMSLCLSKGLCAPVGSVLVGPKDFIKRAAWFRKQQGGGIRQSGWLAKAAELAIDIVWPTMRDTHDKTRALARRLEQLGVSALYPVDTNMIVLDLDAAGIKTPVFREIAESENVKVWGNRLVLHYWTSDDAIERLIQTISKSVELSRSAEASEGDSDTSYASSFKKERR